MIELFYVNRYYYLANKNVIKFNSIHMSKFLSWSYRENNYEIIKSDCILILKYD